MAGKKGPVPNKTYLVSGAGQHYLVDAKSEPAAIAHVVGTAFKARIATTHEIVQATKAGVEIQVAHAPASAVEPVAAQEPATQE